MFLGNQSRIGVPEMKTDLQLQSDVLLVGVVVLLATASVWSSQQVGRARPALGKSIDAHQPLALAKR
jgi:hypothetical protein